MEATTTSAAGAQVAAEVEAGGPAEVEVLAEVEVPAEASAILEGAAKIQDQRNQELAAILPVVALQILSIAAAMEATTTFAA